MQNKNRKSIRLKKYDYSEPGDYFITICTQDRECLFGEIVEGEMILNDWGKIVQKEILKTMEIRKNISIGIFQVMPNHVHLIITILCDGNDGFYDKNNRIGCRGEPVVRPNGNTQNIFIDENILIDQNIRATHRVAPTLKPDTIGAIIGQIKSITSKKSGINLWQRNYHEHIIRNQQSYDEIYTYILSNPQTWDRDRNNPKNLLE